MLFKSGVIASASGSFGGMTVSRGRSGMYMRNRSIPVNPASGAQVSVRAIFGNLSARWSTLTAAQRTAWETYAGNVPVINKLGDQIFLTGQQMYVRCNATRQVTGLAVVDNGPTAMTGATLSATTASVSATGNTISVTFETTDPWVDEDDAALAVYISTDKGVGVNYHRGPYRLAGKIDGDSSTPPTSPDATLTSPFTHTVGNNTFFRFVAVRADGRISAVQFRGPVSVTA